MPVIFYEWFWYMPVAGRHTDDILCWMVEYQQVTAFFPYGTGNYGFKTKLFTACAVNQLCLYKCQEFGHLRWLW